MEGAPTSVLEPDTKNEGDSPEEEGAAVDPVVPEEVEGRRPEDESNSSRASKEKAEADMVG